MPLSEHEQKMLQQMEQALYAEDPHFATRLQNPDTSAQRRRIILGVVGVLVGLGLVFVGVVNAQVVFGGLGFALMVAGAAYAFTPVRRSKPAQGKGADGAVPAPKGGRGGGSFMQRLEQRWDQRGEDR